MEDSIKQGADGHAHYLLKLKDIHSDIVTASKEGVRFFNMLFYHQKEGGHFHWFTHSVRLEVTPEDQDPVPASPMPFPDIQFIIWHNDDDLCE